MGSGGDEFYYYYLFIFGWVISMMMGHWRGSLVVGEALDGFRVFVAGFRSGLSWVCGCETF